MAAKKSPIGELLVRRRALSAEALRRALAEPSSGEPLASRLVAEGLVSAADAILALCEQFGRPAVDLTRARFRLSVLDLVPREVAEEQLILPLQVRDETLLVAMANPDAQRLIDEIEFVTGKAVHAYVALASQVREAVRLAYDLHDAGETHFVGAHYEEPAVEGQGDAGGVEAARVSQAPAVPADREREDDEPLGASRGALVFGETVRELGGQELGFEDFGHLSPDLSRVGALETQPRPVASPPPPEDGPVRPSMTGREPERVGADVPERRPVRSGALDARVEAPRPSERAPAPEPVGVHRAARPSNPAPEREAPRERRRDSEPSGTPAPRAEPGPERLKAKDPRREEAPVHVEPRGEARATSQSAASGKTVLVVDDEAEIRAFVRRVLERRGHHVLEADRGGVALRILKETTPDLIVLDAMLPEIHGFDIARRVNGSQRYGHVPIVMISAVYRGWRFAEDLRESCGVRHYIEKPFSMRQLLDAVDEALAPSPEGAERGDQRAMSAEAERALAEGVAAYREGRLDEAIEHLQRGLKIDPFAFRLRFHLGLLFGKKGQVYDAIAELEAAAGINGRHFATAKNLAVLYQQAGFRNKAAELWERARSLAPDEPTRRSIKTHLLTLL